MQKGFRRTWEHDRTRLSTIVVLAVVWVFVVVGFNRPSEMQRSVTAEAVYERVAVSVALQALVASEYPGVLRRRVGFDEESLREEAARYFDAATRAGKFPVSALPHWALLFERLGDPDRAEEALERSEGHGDSELKKQRKIAAALLREEKISPDLVAWADQRYRDGSSELPEWFLLGFHHGESDIVEWMVDHGHRILRRGMTADALLFVVIGVAVWGLVRILRERATFFPTRRRFRLESRGWRGRRIWREYLVAEMLGFGVSMLVGLAFQMVGLGAIGWVIAVVVFMVLPPAWMTRRMTPGFRANLRLFGVSGHPWPAGKHVAFAFVGVGFILVASLAMQSLDRDGDFLVDTIVPEELDYWFSILWSYFVAVVLASICEEWVFRGFLFGGLRHRWGVWPAALVSTLVFSLLHSYSLVGLAAIFLFGLIFCWLYQRSGSLIPPILAHAALNLVSTSQMVGWYSLH